MGYRSATRRRLTRLEAQSSATAKLVVSHHQLTATLHVRHDRMADDVEAVRGGIGTLSTETTTLRTDLHELRGQTNRLELALERGITTVSAQLETIRGLLARDEQHG